MESINKDLAKILLVDDFVMNRISQNAIYCICDYIESAQLNNEDVCKIDIGIGTLTIKIEDDTVRYKFIPSNDLEAGIVSTLENGQNLLEKSVSSRLVNQLKSIYKEFV